MKTISIAILLGAFTFNAFAVSEQCSGLKETIQTEIGEFRIRTETYSEIGFRSDKILFGVSDLHQAFTLLAGGAKRNNRGLLVPLAPIQHKPFLAAADAADFMIAQFSKYVYEIKTHENAAEYDSLRYEQDQDDLFRLPVFSSDDQPLFVKGVIRNFSNKLDEVKVNAGNEKAITCAREIIKDFKSKM